MIKKQITIPNGNGNGKCLVCGEKVEADVFGFFGNRDARFLCHKHLMEGQIMIKKQITIPDGTGNGKCLVCGEKVEADVFGFFGNRDARFLCRKHLMEGLYKVTWTPYLTKRTKRVY